MNRRGIWADTRLTPVDTREQGFLRANGCQKKCKNPWKSGIIGCQNLSIVRYSNQMNYAPKCLPICWFCRSCLFPVLYSTHVAIHGLAGCWNNWARYNDASEGSSHHVTNQLYHPRPGWQAIKGKQTDRVASNRSSGIRSAGDRVDDIPPIQSLALLIRNPPGKY